MKLGFSYIKKNFKVKYTDLVFAKNCVIPNKIVVSLLKNVRFNTQGIKNIKQCKLKIVNNHQKILQAIYNNL